MRVSSTACRMVTITHRDQLTGLYREGVLSGPVLVLGGGSNILFRSSTERLVIKNEIRFIRPGEETDRHTLLTVGAGRSEEHTSELQSRGHIVCRPLLEKKNENSST